MRSLWVGLTFLVVGTIAHAGDPFALDKVGTLPSGQPYHLVIREAVYERKPGENSDDGSRWVIDGGYPRSFVDEFSLSLGKRKVFLPRKFFNDMSHIRDASVDEQK